MLRYVLNKWHICTVYLFSSPCFHFTFHQVFIFISNENNPYFPNSIISPIYNSPIHRFFFCLIYFKISTAFDNLLSTVAYLFLWIVTVYSLLFFLHIWQISLPWVLLFDSSHYVILGILQTSIFCLLVLLLHQSIDSILWFQLKLAIGLDITSMANGSGIYIVYSY